MFSLRSTRIKAALAVLALAFTAAAGHAQINPNQILWPTGSAGCVYAPGTNTCIVPTGGSPATPVGTPQVNAGSGAFGSDSNTWIAEAGLNGMLCNGTDDTSAFNTLLGTVYAAGGGVIKVNGTCRISGQITIPNNGAGSPSQPTIRITSVGSSANGLFNAPPTNSGTLDMRFNASNGKILTLGAGKLEIDHLTLLDGGSDCAPFIYTTTTTISVHDNLISGTATGSSACNDAIILGGLTTTFGTGATTDGFQGYGTYIEHNFFDKIRRGVYLREAANAVVVRDNTWSRTCGATSSQGAVEIGFSGRVQVQSNIFSGNLFETTNYPYVYNVWDDNNLFFGDTFWDASINTLFLFHFQSGADYNTGYISRDASISTAMVSDSSQPSGSNAIMDQVSQGALGLATVQGKLCLDSSGSGTAQTCTTSPSFTPGLGSWIIYKTTTANTGAGLTINVNSLGAKSVAKWQTTTTLAANDVRAGAFIPMYYDGTNWEAASIGNAPSTSGLSGMTAGQVAIAATASTVTSSKVLAGAGAGITTGPTSSTNLDCAQFNGTTGQIADAGAPCGTGGSLTLTTTGTSGPATYTGGTLNIPVYSSGGGGGMPFTVVQETMGGSGNGTSFTLTYPKAAAASGNTEWLIVATGGTTITTPSGWTLDVDYNPAYHVAVYHRTSASDTSVAIAVGATTQIGVYYVELVGARSLDVSTTFANAPVSNGLNTYSLPLTGSITPTAGAWVLSATCTASGSTIGASPVIPSANSLWTARANNTQGSYKLLVLQTGNFTATATSTAAPSPNLFTGTVDTGNPAATILFSIK